MKSTTLLAAVLAALPLAHAQDPSTFSNLTVPATCEGNTTSGYDVTTFTVPYTYAQVLSIIGSYKNLTWSGNPDDTVTLNGSDNTVGTARSYYIDGAHLVETIDVYSSPPGGPYNEIHTAALFYFPPLNVSLYIPYDGTVVQSVCDGRATQFNFTAEYCADNVTAAGAVLHAAHLGDAQTVGMFLGGMNFSSCEALGSGNGSATATATAPVSTFTGGAGGLVNNEGGSKWSAAGLVAGAALLMAL